MEPRLPTIGPVDLHGPAIHNPQLKAFVELARAQPLPRLKVDAEAVRRGWEAERAKGRRRAVLAVAAVLLGVVGVTAISRALESDRSTMNPTENQDVVARGDDAREDSPPASGNPDARAETTEGGSHPTPPTQAVDPTPAPPALAQGVRVQNLEIARDPEDVPAADAAAAFQVEPGVAVVSTWSVNVAAGRYEIEVPVEADSTLVVNVVDKHVLEVDPGSVVQLSTGSGLPTVKVLSGGARLVGADGTRIEFAPAKSRTASKGLRIESAGELARKAEALMAAGEHKQAIGVLEQLVDRYPRSSAARAGLIDLAKLLEKGGRRDRARCAYQLYLDRWPGTPVRAELERAIVSLGGAGKCRGLRPR